MRTNVAELGGQHDTISRALALIIAMACLLLATLALFAAGSRLLAVRASAYWTGTEGVIIESRESSNCILCRPTINYHYAVNGRGFVGVNIAAGPQDYYNQNDASVKVRAYPVGRKVTVYYDPSDPASSCLEPGVARWFGYAYLAFAGCLTSGGFAFCWRLCRSKPGR